MSPLSQSHSSLAVPGHGDGSLSETGRESFESAAESLRDDARHAFTDDELDRLQTRSPPLMQRSRTEQDWNSAIEQLHTLPNPSPSLLDDELDLPSPPNDSNLASTSIRRPHTEDSDGLFPPSRRS
jgi:broad specificity phosphatase PhoE